LHANYYKFNIYLYEDRINEKIVKRKLEKDYAEDARAVTACQTRSDIALTISQNVRLEYIPSAVTLLMKILTYLALLQVQNLDGISVGMKKCIVVPNQLYVSG